MKSLRTTTTLGDLQRHTVALALLREVPALGADRLRCARHPLGTGHVERQAPTMRSVHGLRPQRATLQLWPNHIPSGVMVERPT